MVRIGELKRGTRAVRSEQQSEYYTDVRRSTRDSKGHLNRTHHAWYSRRPAPVSNMRAIRYRALPRHLPSHRCRSYSPTVLMRERQRRSTLPRLGPAGAAESLARAPSGHLRNSCRLYPARVGDCEFAAASRSNPARPLSPRWGRRHT